MLCGAVRCGAVTAYSLVLLGDFHVDLPRPQQAQRPPLSLALALDARRASCHLAITLWSLPGSGASLSVSLTADHQVQVYKCRHSLRQSTAAGVTRESISRDARPIISRSNSDRSLSCTRCAALKFRPSDRVCWHIPPPLTTSIILRERARDFNWARVMESGCLRWLVCLVAEQWIDGSMDRSMTIATHTHAHARTRTRTRPSKAAPTKKNNNNSTSPDK